MNVHATDAKPKVIEVNPDAEEHEYKVELGGILQLELKAHDFDIFEIIFEESWPPKARAPLHGSTDKHISIPMPDKKSEYKGHIVFKKNGTPKGKPKLFKAISCMGCG